MALFIVMDHTGDTRQAFDYDDPTALANAETLFRSLTERGHTAATRTATGEVKHIRSFDPTAGETLFFPRIVGG